MAYTIHLVTGQGSTNLTMAQTRRNYSCLRVTEFQVGRWSIRQKGFLNSSFCSFLASNHEAPVPCQASSGPGRQRCHPSGCWRLVGAGNQSHLTADLHLNRTEWARMEKINLVLLWWETQQSQKQNTTEIRKLPQKRLPFKGWLVGHGVSAELSAARNRPVRIRFKPLKRCRRLKRKLSRVLLQPRP